MAPPQQAQQTASGCWPSPSTTWYRKQCSRAQQHPHLLHARLQDVGVQGMEGAGLHEVEPVIEEVAAPQVYHAAAWPPHVSCRSAATRRPGAACAVPAVREDVP